MIQQTRIVLKLAAVSLHRFVSREEAGASVEFGLLAAPFVAGLFAILQTALIFFAGVGGFLLLRMLLPAL